MKLCKSGDHELPDNHTGRCRACRRASASRSAKKAYGEGKTYTRRKQPLVTPEAAAEIWSFATTGSDLRAVETGWMDKALCLEVDPEIFFPERGESPQDSKNQIAQAKSVCAQCEAREQCLAYAYELDIEYGVFGGLTNVERERSKALAS